MNCWLLSLSASVVYSVPAWAVYIFLFSQILSSFSFNCFGVGCQACIPSSGNQASWISLSSGMAHYKYATCWFLRYLRVDAVDADNLSHMGGRGFYISLELWNCIQWSYTAVAVFRSCCCCESLSLDCILLAALDSTVCSVDLCLDYTCSADQSKGLQQRVMWGTAFLYRFLLEILTMDICWGLRQSDMTWHICVYWFTYRSIHVHVYMYMHLHVYTFVMFCYM